METLLLADRFRTPHETAKEADVFLCTLMDAYDKAHPTAREFFHAFVDRVMANMARRNQ